MLFAAEAYVKGGLERYRLQQDGSWRKVRSVFARHSQGFDLWDGVESSDVLLESLDDVYRLAVVHQDFITKNGTYSFYDSGKSEERAFIHYKVFRTAVPRVFSVAELQEVIEAGDLSRSSVLVLTLNGFFGLWGIAQARTPRAPIAVRFRFFAAGTNCVGERAAEDEYFIAITYGAMLEGWYKHLLSGELGEYVDEHYCPGYLIRTLRDVSGLEGYLQQH